MLRRFFAYGFVGWAVEVTFTSVTGSAWLRYWLYSVFWARANRK